MAGGPPPPCSPLLFETVPVLDIETNFVGVNLWLTKEERSQGVPHSVTQ
jgi:hypothetical protein